MEIDEKYRPGIERISRETGADSETARQHGQIHKQGMGPDDYGDVDYSGYMPYYPRRYY